MTNKAPNLRHLMAYLLAQSGQRKTNVDSMISPAHRVRLKRDADIAVPMLVQALQDENARGRTMATNVLKQLDPEAAAKAGVK